MPLKRDRWPNPVWVAIVDERTTLICLDANGQIADDNGYFVTMVGQLRGPPAHWGCRSIKDFVVTSKGYLTPERVRHAQHRYVREMRHQAVGEEKRRKALMGPAKWKKAQEAARKTTVPPPVIGRRMAAAPGKTVDQLLEEGRGAIWKQMSFPQAIEDAIDQGVDLKDLKKGDSLRRLCVNSKDGFHDYWQRQKATLEEVLARRGLGKTTVKAAKPVAAAGKDTFTDVWAKVRPTLPRGADTPDMDTLLRRLLDEGVEPEDIVRHYDWRLGGIDEWGEQSWGSSVFAPPGFRDLGGGARQVFIRDRLVELRAGGASRWEGMVLGKSGAYESGSFGARRLSDWAIGFDPAMTVEQVAAARESLRLADEMIDSAPPWVRDRIVASLGQRRIVFRQCVIDSGSGMPVKDWKTIGLTFKSDRMPLQMRVSTGIAERADEVIDTTLLAESLVHETGHCVHYADDAVLPEWKRLFSGKVKAAYREGDRGYWYAAQDEFEGFAETWRKFICGSGKYQEGIAVLSPTEWAAKSPLERDLAGWVTKRFGVAVREVAPPTPGLSAMEARAHPAAAVRLLKEAGRTADEAADEMFGLLGDTWSAAKVSGPLERVYGLGRDEARAVAEKSKRLAGARRIVEAPSLAGGPEQAAAIAKLEQWQARLRVNVSEKMMSDTTYPFVTMLMSPRDELLRIERIVTLKRAYPGWHLSAAQRTILARSWGEESFVRVMAAAGESVDLPSAILGMAALQARAVPSRWRSLAMTELDRINATDEQRLLVMRALVIVDERLAALPSEEAEVLRGLLDGAMAMKVRQIRLVRQAEWGPEHLASETSWGIRAEEFSGLASAGKKRDEMWVYLENVTTGTVPTPEGLAYTFLHEMAHEIDYAHEWAAGRAFSVTAMGPMRAAYIAGDKALWYAVSNPQELFAEMVAMRVLGSATRVSGVSARTAEAWAKAYAAQWEWMRSHVLSKDYWRFAGPDVQRMLGHVPGWTKTAVKAEAKAVVASAAKGSLWDDWTAFRFGSVEDAIAHPAAVMRKMRAAGVSAEDAARMMHVALGDSSYVAKVSGPLERVWGLARDDAKALARSFADRAPVTPRPMLVEEAVTRRFGTADEIAAHPAVAMRSMRAAGLTPQQAAAEMLDALGPKSFRAKVSGPLERVWGISREEAYRVADNALEMKPTTVVTEVTTRVPVVPPKPLPPPVVESWDKVPDVLVRAAERAGTGEAEARELARQVGTIVKKKGLKLNQEERAVLARGREAFVAQRAQERFGADGDAVVKRLAGWRDGWRSRGVEHLDTDPDRVAMMTALEHVKAGRTETLDDQAMAIQLEWSRAVMSQHYKPGEEIEVVRMVYGDYARAIAMADDVGEAWTAGNRSLSSWAISDGTETSLRRLMKKAAGKDGEVIMLRMKVPQDQVAIAFWGDELLRTDEVVALGEMVLDGTGGPLRSEVVSVLLDRPSPMSGWLQDARSLMAQLESQGIHATRDEVLVGDLLARSSYRADAFFERIGMEGPEHVYGSRVVWTKFVHEHGWRYEDVDEVSWKGARESSLRDMIQAEKADLRKARQDPTNVPYLWKYEMKEGRTLEELIAEAEEAIRATEVRLEALTKEVDALAATLRGDVLVVETKQPVLTTAERGLGKRTATQMDEARRVQDAANPITQTYDRWLEAAHVDLGFSSSAEAEAAFKAGWQPLLDQGQVTVHVPRQAGRQVLRDGRLKSQFETKTSTEGAGLYDPTVRRKAEHGLFGIEGTAVAERPIYGCVEEAVPDGSVPMTKRRKPPTFRGGERIEGEIEDVIDTGSGGDFGEVEFVLSKGARSRTTCTFEDSLGYGQSWDDVMRGVPPLSPSAAYTMELRPTWLDDVDWRVACPRSVEFKIGMIGDPGTIYGGGPKELEVTRRLFRPTKLRDCGGSYVETQTHGGIAMKDVELVRIRTLCHVGTAEDQWIIDTAVDALDKGVKVQLNIGGRMITFATREDLGAIVTLPERIITPVSRYKPAELTATARKGVDSAIRRQDDAMQFEYRRWLRDHVGTSAPKELDRAERQFAKAWQEQIDRADATIHVPRQRAAAILEDGRLKSQFETGFSTEGAGTYSPQTRAAVERSRFGYAESMPARQRPIYGCLEDTVKDGGDGMGSATGDGYGQVEFVLTKEARAKTTLLFEDSLSVVEGSHAEPVCMWMDKIDPHVAAGSRSVDWYPHGIGDCGKLYIETQTHGGVTLGDVAYVRLRRSISYDGGWEIEVVRKALDKGVPVQVGMGDYFRGGVKVHTFRTREEFEKALAATIERVGK